MINRKKITIVITIVILIIILGFLSYYFYFSGFQPKELTHALCLSGDEFADFDYDVDLYNSTGVKLPINTTTTIYKKDKNTDEELFRFVISDVRTNSPSLEIHECGVYVIRNFDLDEKKGFYKKQELWRYTYNGKGRILMNHEELYPYSSHFKTDPREIFLALEKLYLTHPDYGIVVKNLKSSNPEDIFSINPQDIIEKNPHLNPERFIGVVGWSKDGKYLWGGSKGQTDYVYFRINIDEKDKKNIEVFVMPDDAVHFGPPRVNNGYVWYVYGPPWVGIHELGEQIYEEWQKEGKKEILYLYNLFKQEKILLASIDNPSWNFKPKWISDSELEYYLPSGERKVYKIDEE